MKQLTDPLPRLPPVDFIDPVIEAYKRDVDQTMLRENLKLSVEERSWRFLQSMKTVNALRAAVAKAHPTANAPIGTDSDTV
jgi:hypothetical protein